MKRLPGRGVVLTASLALLATLLSGAAFAQYQITNLVSHQGNAD
jgi:hypothetical protein